MTWLVIYIVFYIIRASCIPCYFWGARWSLLRLFGGACGQNQVCKLGSDAHIRDVPLHMVSRCFAFYPYLLLYSKDSLLMHPTSAAPCSGSTPAAPGPTLHHPDIFRNRLYASVSVINSRSRRMLSPTACWRSLRACAERFETQESPQSLRRAPQSPHHSMSRRGTPLFTGL
jgi:hypothetical protein